MKKISVFLAGSMLALTLLTASFSAFAQTDLSDFTDSSGTLQKGLKGSINGVVACHCPDDAANCYCSQ